MKKLKSIFRKPKKPKEKPRPIIHRYNPYAPTPKPIQAQEEQLEERVKPELEEATQEGPPNMRNESRSLSISFSLEPGSDEFVSEQSPERGSDSKHPRRRSSKSLEFSGGSEPEAGFRNSTNLLRSEGELESALSTRYRTPSPTYLSSYALYNVESHTGGELRKRSRTPTSSASSSTTSTISQTSTITLTHQHTSQSPPLSPQEDKEPELKPQLESPTQYLPIALPPRPSRYREKNARRIQPCPYCTYAFGNPMAKDMHILQVHHLHIPPSTLTQSKTHLETLQEIPHDPGNYTGPLGINAHIIEPERFLGEEPEAFGEREEIGMDYWKIGFMRFGGTFHKVEEIDELLAWEREREMGERERDEQVRAERNREEIEETDEGAEESDEEEEEDRQDGNEDANEDGEEDEKIERELVEDEITNQQTAELEEEEAMWKLGLVRYGGRWIGTDELENLDVEEEERKVFSIWLRENGEREKMRMLERFENLSDGDVRELQELGEEIDRDNWGW